MKTASISLCALLALAGCARGNAEPAAASSMAVDWRSIATEHDRERLRDWRPALVRALRSAEGAGFGADIAREGALLEPDAAIAWGELPQGEYRCRMIKLGAKSEGMLGYVAYPPFVCRVRQEGDLIGFAKLTGSQRPIGHILPATHGRMVFLGTMQLSDETRALDYGRDQERDMAGLVQRIGPSRWRIVFPSPHFESLTDVLELVPR